MLRLQPLLQELVKEKNTKQVSVIYALQAFCHDNGHPKGLMLRFSKYCYDFDIVEEDAFTDWQDEIRDDVPGKGDVSIPPACVSATFGLV